ncbi:flavonol reductase [Xylariaceae sp. FL0255]|nr:flavonol reductase [Xylariaceae sp. FL0255]
MSHRVFLTCGNGFIGSHILAKLLDRAFDAAFKTDDDNPIDAVFHTASPFSSTPVEDKLEVLEPAIKGTLHLLSAVKVHAPSVRRVIVTGSCASVNPITWDEAIKADQSAAYRASKKFAEQEAWSFMKEQNPHFDLVFLNPPTTFGPLRHSISSLKDLNESSSRLRKACFDTTKESPIFYMPVHTYVDVRDLAEAQIQAMLVPEAENQRFIVCARQFNFQHVSDILREQLPELHERAPIGKPGTNSLPAGAYDIDNSKARKVLGIQFGSLEETMLDTARYMLDLEKSEKAV